MENEEGGAGGPTRRRGAGRGRPARTPYDRPQAVQPDAAPALSSPTPPPQLRAAPADGSLLRTWLLRPLSALPSKVLKECVILIVLLLPSCPFSAAAWSTL